MSTDQQTTIDHATPLHRWRLPEKWVGFGALMLAVSATRDVRAALAGLGLAVGIFAIGRCGAHLRRVAQVAGPLALLIVPATALAVTPRGGEFWGVAYSPEGLRIGTVTVVRCVALLLLAVVLVGTTRPGTLFAPLGRLGVPRRLVDILWLAERFVRGVGLEGQRLRRAAQTRGFVLSARVGALRTCGVLAGAHLVRSLQRSERMHAVMAARGYAGAVRTTPPGPRSVADTGLLLLFLLLASGLVSTRWWW